MGHVRSDACPSGLSAVLSRQTEHAPAGRGGVVRGARPGPSGAGSACVLAGRVRPPPTANEIYLPCVMLDWCDFSL